MTVGSEADAAALEAALRDSEARARALIERAPEAVVVVDLAGGHFTEVNAEAERLFGASRGVLLELGPVDLSPPRQPDGRPSDATVQDWLARAVAGETPAFEWVHRRVDGEDVPCEVRLRRLPASDALLVRASIVDIRERRAAEERVRELAAERTVLAARAGITDEVAAHAHRQEAMLAALQDGWFLTADDGTILDANAEFCRIVGWPRDAVVGASQPYPWWPAGTMEREALVRAVEHVHATGGGEFDDLTIVRGDGDRRTIMMSVARLHEPGVPGTRFGTIKDVTERHRAEVEREALLATLAEERDRVVRMQAATAALARAVTRREVTDGVLAHGMRAFGARAAVVMLLDDATQTLRLEGLFGYRRAMFAGLEQIPLDSRSPLAAAVRERRRLELGDLTEWLEERPELAVIVRDVGRAGVCVPMLVHERPVGVLGVAFGDERAFQRASFDDLENLARLAAQAYERARLSELDQQVSRVLQHSLLPEALPVTPDAELAARYVPAVADLEVGGDWYDVIGFDDGRLGLAVGDVVGRGVRAATTMGQLRSALRALALVDDDPAVVLTHLDRFAHDTPGAPMATVVYAVYDPASASIRYSCAGHLPPLLVTESGSTFLVEGRSVPLGAGLAATRDTARAVLEAGDVLLLYTDGLVERRGEAVDRGLDRLAASVPRASDSSLERLADEILRALVADPGGDDVALLALRCTSEPGAPFARRFRADPESLAAVRRDLQRWLTRTGIAPAPLSEVLLAVGEACANAVEHAYVGAAHRGDVELHGRCDAVELMIEVRDEGRWQAPVGVPTRGRGQALMASLMDEVELHTGDAGTVVTMRRRVAAGPATSGRRPPPRDPA